MQIDSKAKFKECLLVHEQNFINGDDMNKLFTTLEQLTLLSIYSDKVNLGFTPSKKNMISRLSDVLHIMLARRSDLRSLTSRFPFITARTIVLDSIQRCS